MTNFVQTIIQGLLLGGVYALAASGLTLVFGVMNVINVAHGALLILAAYLTFYVWTHTGMDPILACVITAPAMKPRWIFTCRLNRQSCMPSNLRLSSIARQPPASGRE